MLVLSAVTGALLYLAPSIIASSRKRIGALECFRFNLFLGWTGIVWVGCMAWSLKKEKN
jgi:hypothetical protein